MCTHMNIYYMCVSLYLKMSYTVYVWKQTESAFSERFMLMVMNDSYWSGKEEGQTGAEKFWKERWDISYEMGILLKVDWK